MKSTVSEPAVPAWCNDIETLFLDLDGCVWFGGELAEGAIDTVALMRRRGKRVAFISNVSSATRLDIAEKLTSLGVPAGPEDVQVPLELLPRHELLADGKAKVLGMCTAEMREALRQLGLDVTDQPESADVVVVGRDPRMTYDDLARATQALCSGARMLAMNLDSRVPLEGGLIVPGTGAIVAALEEATGAAVELIGKPSPFFFETALQTFGATAATTAMIGDTLDSDILGGQRAGLRTVLVGGSSYSRLPEPPVPDLELTTVADLAAYFR